MTDCPRSSIRMGKQFLKVNRGGGEGYLKVKMKSPELPYPSSIAWSLKYLKVAMTITSLLCQLVGWLVGRLVSRSHFTFFMILFL